MHGKNFKQETDMTLRHLNIFMEVCRSDHSEYGEKRNLSGDCYGKHQYTEFDWSMHGGHGTFGFAEECFAAVFVRWEA